VPRAPAAALPLSNPLPTRRSSALCEPDEGKPARWHWFALKDGGDPRPPFAFAGIYRTWKGPIKKDGLNVDLEVFSFMTTLPNTRSEEHTSELQSRSELVCRLLLET